VGSALIGLIGVAIGALLSGLATFLLARRAEKQQARAAARLLEAELRQIIGRLDLLTSNPIVDGRPPRHLPKLGLVALCDILSAPKPQLWDEHKAILAAVLSIDDWYAVATAYESIDALRGAAVEPENLLFESGLPRHALFEDLLTELALEAQAGADAVTRLAGGPRQPSAHPTIRDQLVASLRERSHEVGGGQPG
jgi:hypothetical protein